MILQTVLGVNFFILIILLQIGPAMILGALLKRERNNKVSLNFFWDDVI